MPVSSNESFIGRLATPSRPGFLRRFAGIRRTSLGGDASRMATTGSITTEPTVGSLALVCNPIDFHGIVVYIHRNSGPGRAVSACLGKTFPEERGAVGAKTPTTGSRTHSFWFYPC